MPDVPTPRSQPAIFYINLDARTDRRQHIEGELHRLGLRAERMAAVTTDEARQAGPTSMTMPELACSLSHRAIWQQIVERGLPGALVLEDDAVLSGDLPVALKALGDRSNYDLVQLETMRANPRLGPRVALSDGTEIGRLMTSSPGAAGYYMTARFARRLLARSDLNAHPVDDILTGRRLWTLYGNRIFQSVPALVVQLMELPSEDALARSDLAPSRNTVHRKKRRTLSRRIRALGVNLVHAARALASFGPTGELWRSHRVRIPIAADIRARFPAAAES